MLSGKSIKELIEKKEIKISVFFEKENDVIEKLTSEKPLLSSSLKNNLYSDRLKLTMGPIVKVLNNKKIKHKHQFKSLKDIYDLRESNNKYIINPGESIIVLTNERINLNNKYACLVVPRISLSDVGIIVSTAYVDACYDGILRLHLSNVSDKPYELSTLESIAQCFFFELSSPVSNEYKDKFSTKSVFFGQTWEGILDSDRNPFPTKKKAPLIDKFQNLKYQFGFLWGLVKKYSLLFWLVTNFVVIATGYITFKNDYIEYTTIIDELQTSFKPLSSEIIIYPYETYGEKEIIVEYAKSDIITILFNNPNINYQILSGDKENETKIIFSTNLSSAQAEKSEINFTYAIIRSVK